MFIDCKGEECPIPVIKAKKALSGLSGDSTLTVSVDNVESAENIGKMASGQGYPFTITENGGAFEITISKSGAGGEARVLENENNVNALNTVVVISSDAMGEGDRELGRMLLSSFLAALVEAERLPKALIFYNGGVKTAVEGSAALGDLDRLAGMGVDILSCGACLKFYGLTGALRAGRISNMFEIVSLMLSNAVVKP